MIWAEEIRGHAEKRAGGKDLFAGGETPGRIRQVKGAKEGASLPEKKGRGGGGVTEREGLLSLRVRGREPGMKNEKREREGELGIWGKGSGEKGKIISSAA